MQSIFDTCTPRAEVLKGDLREEIFAARLRDVMEGRADPVYQDPATYFDNTYPTEGLRSLLNEALGRLTGEAPANNAIIRLETAFGGGKTHNLIGLYHAARGFNPAWHPSRYQSTAFVNPALIPPQGHVRVAGVVGSDLQPRDGLDHGDVTTYTLWGALAYQLGGAEGYAYAEGSDRGRSAPGTGLLEKLRAMAPDAPMLIMLDEIARHLRAAKTVPTATGQSNLAEQTVAFLMSLFEFAASQRHVVVVWTLAEHHDAFGQETETLQRAVAESHAEGQASSAHQEIAEARRVSARQERVITPTGETEIAAIVTHRLFEHLDREAAAEVAQAYTAAYRQRLDMGDNLPQRALRADYVDEIISDYPLHPELLNTLNRKTSTIPNFHKTRGALRLLAMVVRRLWETRPDEAYLIHPFHLDLRVDDIANDLTSRLDRPAFKQVIEADIASPKKGAPAHAQVFDRPLTETGKPPYTRRVATTIFLHSLTQSIASGVDPADLLLATLTPGDDPALVHKAAAQLYEKGWFCDWDGHRYRFKTEPSLNKIIADEMDQVGRTKAKQRLDQRIAKIWKRGTLTVVPFPQEASDVDDNAGPPKLAIIHYDAASVTATDPAPPELVRKIAAHAGSLEAFRRFRNNVLFLVADGDRVEAMVQTTRRYLAINRILGDAERLGEFTRQQQKDLKKKGEAAELDVRVAITKAYRHLYFPRADAPKAHSNLAHDMLPAQEQGEVERDQSAVVLRALRQQNKTLTGDSPTLAAAYVKSKAWDQNATHVTTEALRQAYARRIGLPLLLDINQLKRTILNGIHNHVWIYYDAGAEMGYDAESPPPAIQVSDEAHLYLPAEATRLDLPIKGKVKPPKPGEGGGPHKEEEPLCPLCGHPQSQCTCGDAIKVPETKAPLEAEGVPQQAFQHLLDLCHDQEVTHLTTLWITLQGGEASGARTLRTLGLIIPQLGKGTFTIELRYNAEFGEGEDLTISGTLGWDLYRRLKQVSDALAQEAAKFTMAVTLAIAYPEGLAVQGDTFRTLHEVMTTVGLDTLELHAQARSEDDGAHYDAA